MSLSSTPKGQTNQALALADIHLPAAPSWGLSPIGYAVVITLLLVIMVITWLIYRHYQKAALKRLALKQLSSLVPEKTDDIARLLKQAVLSYFPREQVAALHGTAWWLFIEQQLPEKKRSNVVFLANSRQLEQALYGQKPLSKSEQQRFYNDVSYWLTNALPVKKTIQKPINKGQQHA